MRLLPWVASAWALLSACGRGPRAEAVAADSARPDTMTTRERHEALSRTAIPGAGGIGRALQAADSASSRVRQLDSLTH
ncbi:MAG: hypothetical protein SFV24_19495 [Gemmatimonadales bacterium]|nr:hypothetical protein [Gemmatimonadales bacterium]